MAHLLGNLLKEHCEISTVFSRTQANAQLLVDKIGGEVVSSLKDIDSTADLTIIAVNDYAIQEVASKLPGDLPLVHTSGFTSMDVLYRFAVHGVFYPLQTISKDRINQLTEVPILLESSDDDFLSDLDELARKISNNVNEMDSDQRQYVHLAAVFANNFTNYMLDISDKILKEVFKDIKLFEPLLKETIAKAIKYGPSRSQTGPAMRGDENTMNAHLELLENEDWKALYEIISKNIKKRS